MRTKAGGLLAVGLGVVLLLAGAVPVSAKPASTGSEEVDFQVSAFSASAKETWGWSVTNQANNSGWQKVPGDTTWSGIMQVPGSRRPVLKMSPTLNTGYLMYFPPMTAIPFEAAYCIDLVTRSQQHPPDPCHDAGTVPSAYSYAGIAGGSVPSNRRQPNLINETIAITWPNLYQRVGTDLKCSAPAFYAPDTRFNKVEVVADLAKHDQVTVQVDGLIPLPVPMHVKGKGSYTWKASMTLIRLVNLAPLGE